MATVIVEFYGIARQRSEVATTTLEADTVGEVIRQVAAKFPGLTELMTADCQLSRHFVISLDGERFTSELHESLPDGTRLLLLSADAGG